MAPPAPGKNLSTAQAELTALHQILGLTPSPALREDYKDAVLICIDCEAFERDQRKVTELGVAVLDTRDLRGVTSGENGEEWVAKMKYAHFRPAEYARLVNRKFVKGCEDRFAFGDSTWIRLADAKTVLERIFQAPERLGEVANFASEFGKKGGKGRNVVFVAHGISNDDAYLGALGFQLKNAKNVVRQVDSQRVAGGTKKNSMGLKRLLQHLGIKNQGLHNAGNDAAYTLKAVIMMAVKEYKQPGLIFGEEALSAITLPGVLRQEGVAATHVFGGTAKQRDLELHGKGARMINKVKSAVSKKMGRPKGSKSTEHGAQQPMPKPTLKRTAPETDDADEQPVRKRPAR